jgi:hypothetical protein
MPRGKPPKEIQDRREPGKKQSTQRPEKDAPQTKDSRVLYLKAAVRLIGGLILWTSAILGLVSGWVAMIPRVSVSQNQSLSPSDPFSTPFVVSNDGPLPLMNVRFYCAVSKVAAANQGSVIDLLATHRDLQIHSLLKR